MTPHDVIAFSVRSQNGFTVATINGELAVARVPALRELLLGLPGGQASRIIIDLSRVTCCDVTGLAVLVGVGRRAGLLGGVLRLAAPTPSVAAVLHLTGLDVHFEIFATVSAAAAPARLGIPDASLQRRIPMSQLSARPLARAQATASAYRGVRYAVLRASTRNQASPRGHAGRLSLGERIGFHGCGAFDNAATQVLEIIFDSPARGKIRRYPHQPASKSPPAPAPRNHAPAGDGSCR